MLTLPNAERTEAAVRTDTSFDKQGQMRLPHEELTGKRVAHVRVL